MLIEFSVQNYRSFNQKVTLSMVASSIKEHPEHVFQACGLKLLKSGVLYGANASGKSNLVKAMAFMRNFILESQTKTSSTDSINAVPFLLNANSRKEPSMFEISLLLNESIYRYGFELTPKAVIKEWLYIKECTAYSREKLIWSRTEQSVEPQDIIDTSRLRHNALLISVLNQNNDTHAKLIFEILHDMQVIQDTSALYQMTLELISAHEVPQAWVQQLLKAADLGIDDFEMHEQVMDWGKFMLMTNEEFNIKNPPSQVKVFNTQALHKYYDSDLDSMNIARFDMQDKESLGTKLMFGFAGPLYQVLKSGGMLIVDEMDNSLHYFITKIIVELFQRKETNPNNAQLIFTTHDIIHLDKSRFRRDEVWFTEKNKENATSLYSLAEFKVRNDSSYGKDYLRAKYGAVPYTDFDKFARLVTEDQE
ncbi:MAG: ATP-binding protein [Candidatus Cloacimonetes bacterium]|nr:ATP-binding protein [Candidatus Cloacimonadota bacterium]MDY0171286.1 ATP-binding protein [Candidatus Cloacimonadaceae bacterium]